MNSDLSGKLLKVLQWQFLHSQYQIRVKLSGQVKLVRYVLSFEEEIHFMGQRDEIFWNVAVHDYWILHLDARLTGLVDLVRDQSLFLEYAVYAVKL